KIYQGLHNSRGERAYLSWQIGSELSDASPSYDNTTGKYVLNIPSTGGEYVTKFVKLRDVDNLSDLDGVTFDTLVEWMQIAMVRYLDSLQTTLPDLTAFKEAGGKLLHYHGESDPSVPAASSVHYWQSVKEIMYPSSSFSTAAFSTAVNSSAGSGEIINDALEDWYQFYLIPGAAHCNTNSLQPGPYPEDNMQTMIDWVESGVRPSRLSPRPLWHGNGSEFDCVDDEASIASWTYKFDAFKLPVY
ncbi:Tannase, partial [Hortaea werneckii]